MQLTSTLTEFNSVNTPTGIEFFPANKIEDQIIGGTPYSHIGTNGGSEFYFNKVDGSVWMISDDTKFFVNSSLEQFTRCLNEHARLFNGNQKTDEEKYQATLKLREIISSIDPKALEGDTFWFWTTEEQIEIYEAWNE